MEEERGNPEGSEQEVLGAEPPELEASKPRPRVSLLTVLALLAIVSVLAAILVPNFVRARARGTLTACKSNLKNIGTALEMYSTDWSGKYPTSLDVLTPKYLKLIPECPTTRTVTYRAHFGKAAPMNKGGYEDYYYVECLGENHSAVSVTGNYPAYNGIEGLVERAP